MNLVIGLTGSIASGKSTTSKYIKEKGYKVIDCDQISHDVLLEGRGGYLPLINEFGETILDDRVISRVKLGNIVFNDKVKLQKLNDILHPIIYNEVKSEITNGIVFIDCPLLFETNFIDLCDKTLVVYVDFNTQVKRLMQRDGLSNKEASDRIKLQMSLEEKKQKCDYVIENMKSIDELKGLIDDFLKEL